LLACPLPTAGIIQAMQAATSKPAHAASWNAWRHDTIASNTDVSAGMAAFPRSPEKL
jgi:hypothetical protein